MAATRLVEWCGSTSLVMLEVAERGWELYISPLLRKGGFRRIQSADTHRVNEWAEYLPSNSTTRTAYL